MCFDPVSRDEADSSDNEISDARLQKTSTPTFVRTKARIREVGLIGWDGLL